MRRPGRKLRDANVIYSKSTKRLLLAAIFLKTREDMIARETGREERRKRGKSTGARAMLEERANQERRKSRVGGNGLKAE